MSLTIGARTCAALVLALSTTLVAHSSPAGLTPQENAPREEALQSGERVTIIGCVVSEDVYASATAAPSVGTDRTGAAFVIANASPEGSTFVVTGVREAELAQHVGSRVEVTGTVERPRPTSVAPQTAATSGRPAASPAPAAAAERPEGVTPQGSPAHEPGDARPGTVAIGGTAAAGTAAGTAGTAEEPVALRDLPRINIETVRATGGACEPPAPVAVTPPQRQDRGSSAQAGATSTGAAPPRVTNSPVSEVRVVGCLMRMTPTGPVASATTGDLVLTRVPADAVERRDDAAVLQGAQQASGAGSGTLPPRAGAPPIAERAFVLEVKDAGELLPHVGQRVEIVGAVRETAPASSAADGDDATPRAHHSAPSDRLTVTAFRAVGGTCF